MRVVLACASVMAGAGPSRLPPPSADLAANLTLIRGYRDDQAVVTCCSSGSAYACSMPGDRTEHNERPARCSTATGPQPRLSGVDERPRSVEFNAGVSRSGGPAGRRIAMIVILRRRNGRRPALGRGICAVGWRLVSLGALAPSLGEKATRSQCGHQGDRGSSRCMTT
jgi:hypothetical protein